MATALDYSHLHLMPAETEIGPPAVHAARKDFLLHTILCKGSMVVLNIVGCYSSVYIPL